MNHKMRATRSNSFTQKTIQRPKLLRAGRKSVVDVRNESCLIVNTKGGGHAFIGFHLAKALMGNGHSVTLMNDGDPVNCIFSARV